MGKNKLRTASVLITVSILLLVLFQAYWLNKNWEDTYRRLRREVGVILRETIVRQQMAHMMDGKGNLRIDLQDSSANALVNKQAVGDSSHPPKQPAKRGTSINLVMVNDSARHGKPRVIAFDADRPPEGDEDGSQIVVEFPIVKNAVSIDSVRQSFSKALRDASIPLDFEIKTIPFDTAKWNTRRSEVRLRGGGPGGQQFAARFEWENIQATSSTPFFFMLQKMLWQLVFAVAMVAIIIAALFFLWRNLRLQHRLASQKNDLIANITHELKTPIATVSVAIEALKSFNAINDVERTKEYLTISANELQRLNMLVDKVLKLSMFDQDKISLQHERVDMKQLLAEVLDSMRLQLEKQSANVKVDYGGNDFEMQGDRTHLLSVVYNLVDNAIKYSDKLPVISIYLGKAGGRLHLQVADKGIGIPTEHLTKIFEKFYRVPHGDTHNIKGYGLGLSYVAEVVKRHGGTITVESEEGKGSTFKVDLSAMPA